MFRCKQMFTSYFNILHGIVLKNILLTLQLTQCVTNSPFEKRQTIKTAKWQA
jgi:hypothetical protein